MAESDLHGYEDHLSEYGGSNSDSSSSDDEDSSGSSTDFDGEEVSSATDPDAPPEWRRPFNPGPTAFAHSASPLKASCKLSSTSTPLQILREFVTEKMIEDVCLESNRLVQQVKTNNPNSFKKWTDVLPTEMWRFLAVNVAMGLVKKPSMKLFWSKNEIVSTPFFNKAMSRNRFEEILASLHFHNKDGVTATDTNHFVKLGSFLPSLLQNFRTVIEPGEFLCLDETLIGFKGRVGFRQFNPLKRARFGILIYILMDCGTNTILDMLPYQGKKTNLPDNLVKTLQRGGATVALMSEPYFGKNHKIVTDNFFNSPGLAKYLLENGTQMIGTVQKRRKGMPKMPVGRGKAKKMASGQVKLYCDGKIILERWQDRKEVVMMNTFMEHKMTMTPTRNPHNARKKPDSVLLYNKQMGMIDVMDSQLKPCTHHRRTCKWYKKVFFHLFSMAIYQTFQVYRQLGSTSGRKQPSFYDFNLRIIEEVLETFQLERKTKGRPSNDTTTAAKENVLHLPLKIKKGDCIWCKKNLAKRSQTQIRCSVCEVRLCLQKGEESCFGKFHHELTKPKPKRASNARPGTPILQPANTNDLEVGSDSQIRFSPPITSTPMEVVNDNSDSILSILSV